MNLRRSLVSLCALLTLCLALLITAQAQRKPRIAVLDFDYATVMNNSQALFGTNVDIGRGITDLLVTGLVKNGSFSVIERKALDKILTEQNFSNSERADPMSAAKIGRLLGVDAIIVGSITQFGNDDKHQGVGGGGFGRHGIGLGGISHKSSKAAVGLTARIVNIDTGEILAVAEGKGESKREGWGFGGGGGSWRGGGGGAVDFGSSNFQQTIVGEAVKQATDSLTTDLVTNTNGKIETRTVNITGIVAAVDGGSVILNIGSRAGLKVGDQLTVEHVTREIKDPATGNVLRRLTAVVGTATVTDVDEGSAVCAMPHGVKVKEGDIVKTVMK
ncbi:MAG: CsgG/HfaB family protein [Acidobacteriota bacterium]|nr:CsgG/HfaB family protein [Acidobacteriota bacterium]